MSALEGPAHRASERVDLRVLHGSHRGEDTVRFDDLRQILADRTRAREEIELIQ